MMVIAAVSSTNPEKVFSMSDFSSFHCKPTHHSIQASCSSWAPIRNKLP
jgi:hypothetical protein